MDIQELTILSGKNGRLYTGSIKYLVVKLSMFHSIFNQELQPKRCIVVNVLVFYQPLRIIQRPLIMCVIPSNWIINNTHLTVELSDIIMCHAI